MDVVCFFSVCFLSCAHCMRTATCRFILSMSPQVGCSGSNNTPCSLLFQLHFHRLCALVFWTVVPVGLDTVYVLQLGDFTSFGRFRSGFVSCLMSRIPSLVSCGRVVFSCLRRVVLNYLAIQYSSIYLVFVRPSNISVASQSQSRFFSISNL